MTEKERYGTITAFHRLFQEEGIEVSFPTMAARIESAKKQGEITVILSGRLNTGRILYGAFYLESEVREACADLFKVLPKADKYNLLIVDDETYGTIGGLSRNLGISMDIIQPRIQDVRLKPIRGKDKTGHIFDFYSLSEVSKLCGAFIQELPQADKDGLFEINGETFGTSFSLSRHLGVSEATVRSRIQSTSLKSIRGKAKTGRIFDFFLLSDVQKLCEDLISDLPQADEDNYLKINGESHGTIRSLARRFGISKTTVQSRIQRGAIKPVCGKNRVGHIFDFYPETEVQILCADLIAKRKTE